MTSPQILNLTDNVADYSPTGLTNAQLCCLKLGNHKYPRMIGMRDGRLYSTMRSRQQEDMFKSASIFIIHYPLTLMLGNHKWRRSAICHCTCEKIAVLLHNWTVYGLPISFTRLWLIRKLMLEWVRMLTFVEFRTTLSADSVV